MVRLDHYDWKITPSMLKRPYNLRKSKHDSVYRKWQAFTYRELGLSVETTEADPVMWVCTGTYDTKSEAILEHNDLLREE